MRSIMNDEVFIKNGFMISTDKNLVNFEAVFKYLNQESYWAKGITPEKLKRAIDNSICFGIYQHKQQAGFARVITDKATFAYICDVFILPEFRKHGLSKWLIQTIIENSEFSGLRRWSLATLDAHGLYSQFGFVEISNPSRWMEIFTPYLKEN